MQTPQQTELEELAALAALLDALKSTTSNTLKEELVAESVCRTPRLGRWLRLALDPYKQFYFTAVEVKEGQGEGLLGNGRFQGTFWDFLKACNNRQMGRTLMMSNWLSFAGRLAGPLRNAATAVLNKDLGCRTGVAIVNKGLARTGQPLVPVFDVSLGEPWADEPFWEYGDWYVSRKYDGVRCTLFLYGSGVPGKNNEALSRSGKELRTLQKLLDYFQDYDGPPVVVDGEVSLVTENGADDFQAVMELLMRKDYTIENPVFHAFDLIPLELFREGEGGPCFSERQAALKQFCFEWEGDRLRQVKQRPLPKGDEPATIARWAAQAKARGWEGLVARRDEDYKGRRTKDIWKIKHFQEAEFVVEATKNDKMLIVVDGQQVQADVMARVGIRFKDNMVGVGSGWTVEQRLHYLQHPEDIIGKTITVQYAHETVDKQGRPSLRFPTLKAIHGEERTL